MQHLVGKKFVIDEADYEIIDVRDIDGEVMVYAEPAAGAHGPERAAFRFADIEQQLDAPRVA